MDMSVDELMHLLLAVDDVLCEYGVLVVKEAATGKEFVAMTTEGVMGMVTLIESLNVLVNLPASDREVLSDPMKFVHFTAAMAAKAMKESE